jgi:hypothetical protein
MTITRPPACPSCGSKKTWYGRLQLSGSDDGWVTWFYPKGLRFLTFFRTVALSDGQRISACLHCGHTWSKLNPRELRELLEKSGNDEAQQLLAERT